MAQLGATMRPMALAVQPRAARVRYDHKHAGAGRGIQQKLKGKSARLIVTMGMPAFIYQLVFHAHGVKNIMQGVLGFGGVAPIRLTLFGGVETSTLAAHAARFRSVTALARE